MIPKLAIFLTLYMRVRFESKRGSEILMTMGINFCQIYVSNNEKIDPTFCGVDANRREFKQQLQL